MNLALYTHPDFLGSESQPRFARMLADAYRKRGHTVWLRQPRARLRRLVARGSAAKWAGYVDQYLLFPRELRERAAQDPPDTLHVFCDQALGPWVPTLAHRPHVVHCHDLLALRSALGLIPENPTSATGRIYQRYIRAGFQHARHFISISEKSRADLHEFGGVRPVTSEVIYNGLNHPYKRRSAADAQAALQRAGLPAVERGLLLHVGGGQWYKNTVGVLHLYARLVALRAGRRLAVPPLWLVSPAPGAAIAAALRAVPAAGEVRFFQQLSNETVEALYSLADALLFPSLAEGFGWPIVEAMACGCAVITTDEAPMTEVGGSIAVYLRRLVGRADLDAWSLTGAELVDRLLAETDDARALRACASMAHAAKFDADAAVDRYLEVYRRILGIDSLYRLQQLHPGSS